MGWAVLGLLDVVRLLDGVGCAEVEDLAAQVLQRLAQTQGSDGNWRAVLDDPEAESETSTAAFYVAAALHPAARGLALPAQGNGACARRVSPCAGKRWHLYRRDRGRIAQLGHRNLPALSEGAFSLGTRRRPQSSCGARGRTRRNAQVIAHFGASAVILEWHAPGAFSNPAGFTKVRGLSHG